MEKKTRRKEAIGTRITDLEIGMSLMQELKISALKRNLTFAEYVIKVLKGHEVVNVPAKKLDGT
jgi:hypothetical protein